MAKIGLKTRIVLTLTTILFMAMSLQSIVVIFLGVHASIREDIAFAQQELKSLALAYNNAEDAWERTDSVRTVFSHLQESYNDKFSCLYVESVTESKKETPPCQFIDDLRATSKQAQANRKFKVAFAGGGWHVFLIRSEMAIFAMPLLNETGQVIGSISAERSLLPIYVRYKKEMSVILCYILVNVILFSVLGFFRFSRIIFKPLDKLVLVAENYYPNEESLLSFSDDESAFRKLSASLNALLDRIKRDNRRLRSTVSELELANKELKAKNDLVVRSEKLASVGRLSAGLAHEIGNPLSIVQGYFELLQREDLSLDEKKHFSEKTQQELNRIKKMIGQLLDFSRSMPAEVEESKVAVNQLIREVCGFLSLQKAVDPGMICLELLAEKDEILTDRDSLQQVLINLLFNAVDATADIAERRIEIATSNEKNAVFGSSVVISVLDNGIGISKENLPIVFDPFFTTKEVGCGTGLGLYVCHTIIDGLGGTISIQNRMPAGIEVRIELPLNILL